MDAQTLILFPKYTSLVGTGAGQSYYSEAFDVSGFNDVRGQVLVEAMAGGGTASALFEDSADLINWTGVGAQALTIGTVSNISKTDSARYLRLKITISTANAVATVWARAVARGQ